MQMEVRQERLGMGGGPPPAKDHRGLWPHQEPVGPGRPSPPPPRERLEVGSPLSGTGPLASENIITPNTNPVPMGTRSPFPPKP